MKSSKLIFAALAASLAMSFAVAAPYETDSLVPGGLTKLTLVKNGRSTNERVAVQQEAVSTNVVISGAIASRAFWVTQGAEARAWALKDAMAMNPQFGDGVRPVSGPTIGLKPFVQTHTTGKQLIPCQWRPCLSYDAKKVPDTGHGLFISAIAAMGTGSQVGDVYLSGVIARPTNAIGQSVYI